MALVGGHSGQGQNAFRHLPPKYNIYTRNPYHNRPILDAFQTTAKNPYPNMLIFHSICCFIDRVVYTVAIQLSNGVEKMTRQQFIDENGNWCVDTKKRAEMALGFNDVWFIKCSDTAATLFKGSYTDAWAFFDAL